VSTVTGALILASSPIFHYFLDIFWASQFDFKVFGKQYYKIYLLHLIVAAPLSGDCLTELLNHNKVGRPCHSAVYLISVAHSYAPSWSLAKLRIIYDSALYKGVLVSSTLILEQNI
jgi:hypothetical protein